MNELVSKLSSYNIFNYLLPGVVFVALSPAVTGYSFVQGDMLVAAFLYYFIGLVISRFGSLVIEPVLKLRGFLKFANYKKFVSASKEDPKIEVLSEANNTYRTLCAMFALLLILRLYRMLASAIPVLQDWNVVILFTVLSVMLVFSYRKQTEYITKRIEAKG